MPELQNDKDDLAEAWLSWKNQDSNLKLGWQTLDLPFVGSHDWCVYRFTQLFLPARQDLCVGHAILFALEGALNE